MMANVIKMKIQLRRDTAANWDLYKNEIPASGEPCFVIDKNILKIGDGVTTFEKLPSMGGVSIDVDGKSLVLKDGVLKLLGFDEAEVGAQPRKDVNGNIEWVVPSTATVDGLQSTVAGLKSDVSDLQTDVADLQAIVGSADEGSGTLLSRVEELEREMDTFVTSMNDNGKVDTLKELIEYIENHGDEASDMVKDIKTLQDLVGSDPVADQILAAIEASEKKANATFEHVKYEISHKPAGALVDYRDKEIRVMIPAGTEFELQNSGEGADADAYYIGFKAYAPDDAVSFKEDLAEIIADGTMYAFEGNDFAGVDVCGRKYSIVWLPVAKYADGVWAYYGEKSSKSKYVGWYYSVEWYDTDGKKIGSDCIRINLSNEACHNAIEPFYIANVVKEVAVNGTLLDVVNGRVDVDIPEIKGSDEIEVADDGTLTVKSIRMDKIVQADDDFIIMDGGSAV